MRLVLDTNIVVAGLLWHGPPRLLLNAARSRTVMIFLSIPLLLELDDVLHRPKFSTRLQQASVRAEELVMGYASLCNLISSPPIAPVILDDPDDDIVLACAVAAQVDAVVSGDRHLLEVERYRGIPILRAADCLRRIHSD